MRIYWQSWGSCEGVQLQPLERLLHGSHLGCAVVRDLPPALHQLGTFAQMHDACTPANASAWSVSEVKMCASPTCFIADVTTTCRLSLLSAAV